MKKIISKDSHPKPYRQLVPVILFLAINLTIYLYVISVSSINLNLFKPTASDYSTLLVIGSYISTAIAMLLTLTSYFSIKAYIKRNNTQDSTQEINQVITPDTNGKKPKINIEKKTALETKTPSDKAPANTPKEETPEIKVTQTPEPKIQGNLTPIKEKTTEDAVKPNKIKESWKKIEIKIPDETINKDNNKSSENELIIIPELINEQSDKIVQNKGKDTEVSIQPITDIKAPETPPLITELKKTSHVPENMEKNAQENSNNNATNVTTQLQPEQLSETMPVAALIELKPELMEEEYDSEVLRNIQELKQIVIEMRSTINNKKTQN